MIILAKYLAQCLPHYECLINVGSCLFRWNGAKGLSMPDATEHLNHLTDSLYPDSMTSWKPSDYNFISCMVLPAGELRQFY